MTTSRDPGTPRTDVGGLILSVLAVGTLVYTIIEAPEHGWGSTTTFAGFTLAAGLLLALVRWERSHDGPMIDVSLFANMSIGVGSS